MRITPDWFCAWNQRASPLRIQGRPSTSNLLSVFLNAVFVFKSSRTTKCTLLSTGDWKTVFLRLISLDTKQQRLEKKDFTWCHYAKYGVNKHRGSTYRRIFLSQVLYYRKKITNWDKTLQVRKRKDNISMWVFFAVLGGRRSRLACYLCVYIYLINFFTACPCIPMNPTPPSFLHLTFTEMEENYYSAISPQFICSSKYEAELSG